MNVTGIIILIVGAVLFTVSFFVPDGKNNTKKSKELEEKLVHEAVEHEITKYKYKMDRQRDRKRQQRFANSLRLRRGDRPRRLWGQRHRRHDSHGPLVPGAQCALSWHLSWYAGGCH